MAAFGLHMTLMTDTAFPFAPMGLVHLRNIDHAAPSDRASTRRSTSPCALPTCARTRRASLIDIVTTVTSG